jgi:hypothetical protein
VLATFGLIDANSFYCSCEQAFSPSRFDHRHQPFELGDCRDISTLWRPNRLGLLP